MITDLKITINVFFGTNGLINLNVPMSFDNFFVILWLWSFHSNLPSMMAPSLTEGSSVILVNLCQERLSFVWYCLLSINLLLNKHWWFWTIILRWFYTSLILFPLAVTLLWSANILAVEQVRQVIDTIESRK